MAREVAVSKFNYDFCSSLFGCLQIGAVMARNSVCLCAILSQTKSISVEFTSLIVAELREFLWSTLDEFPR